MIRSFRMNRVRDYRSTEFATWLISWCNEFVRKFRPCYISIPLEYGILMSPGRTRRGSRNNREIFGSGERPGACISRDRYFTTHCIYLSLDFTRRVIPRPVLNGRTCAEFGRRLLFSLYGHNPVAFRIRRQRRRRTSFWNPNLIPQQHVLEYNLTRAG